MQNNFIRVVITLLAILLIGGCLQSDNFNNGSIEDFWTVSEVTVRTLHMCESIVSEADGLLVS